MITLWQINPVPHKFALVTVGPSPRLWDWTAGAYSPDGTAFDEAKHLKADESASIPGLRTAVVPEAARPPEVVGLAAIPFWQSEAGWTALDPIPLDTLAVVVPTTINNSGTVYIGGR